MPRPLRLEFENAWYHVMSRGASRQKIFTSSHHRNMFMNLLGYIGKIKHMFFHSEKQ